MDNRPTILSQVHVSKALADQRFYELIPEFRALQAKLAAAKIDLNAGRGCSSCRKTRAVASFFSDFMSIASALSPDGVRRLKEYLGVQALMMNTMDRTTGQVQLKTL